MTTSFALLIYPTSPSALLFLTLSLWLSANVFTAYIKCMMGFEQLCLLVRPLGIVFIGLVQTLCLWHWCERDGIFLEALKRCKHNCMAPKGMTLECTYVVGTWGQIFASPWLEIMCIWGISVCASFQSMGKKRKFHWPSFKVLRVSISFFLPRIKSSCQRICRMELSCSEAFNILACMPNDASCWCDLSHSVRE